MVQLSIWNILEMLFPEMVKLLMPDPMIVRFFVILISPDVSEIRLIGGRVNVIVSLAPAQVTISLSEPLPLSFVFDTMVGLIVTVALP